jgi:hypothetical protein
LPARLSTGEATSREAFDEAAWRKKAGRPADDDRRDNHFLS